MIPGTIPPAGLGSGATPTSTPTSTTPSPHTMSGSGQNNDPTQQVVLSQEQLRSLILALTGKPLPATDGEAPSIALSPDVQSLQSLFPGLNVQQAEKIFNNKFQPLDLIRLRSSAFTRNTGAEDEDELALVDGRLQTRKARAKETDYPTIGQWADVWNIYIACLCRAHKGSGH